MITNIQPNISFKSSPKVVLGNELFFGSQCWLRNNLNFFRKFVRTYPALRKARKRYVISFSMVFDRRYQVVPRRMSQAEPRYQGVCKRENDMLYRFRWFSTADTRLCQDECRRQSPGIKERFPKKDCGVVSNEAAALPP